MEAGGDGGAAHGQREREEEAGNIKPQGAHYTHIIPHLFALSPPFLSSFQSRFLAEGLLNTETGLSYRREVISRGGSVDASVMLRNFLGREPNDTAFLRSKGLEVK